MRFLLEICQKMLTHFPTNVLAQGSAPAPQAISDVPKSRISPRALARTCLRTSIAHIRNFGYAINGSVRRLRSAFNPPLKGGHIAAGSLPPSPKASVNSAKCIPPSKGGSRAPLQGATEPFMATGKIADASDGLGCTYPSESCVSSDYTRF